MITDREQLYLYIHRKMTNICLLRIEAALPIIRRETINISKNKNKT